MSILAYDLGASSGRAILGQLTDRGIQIEEIHRFPNDPIQVGDRLHWDILRIFHEMKQALLKAKHKGGPSIQSLGIDSWAVDFGIVGNNGELLGNPYHYRDRHTEGVMEQLFSSIPPSEIFRRTGIAFLPFNTIYQLYALKQSNSLWIREAHYFLMIPDLLRYFFTGEKLSEFSNATTTQLFNPTTSGWDQELLQRLEIPHSMFSTIVQPGTQAGTLRSAIRTELGVGGIPVIAVAEHDTGSAVAAVPALYPSFAYLSCGTWSLMGTEISKPILSDAALELNFTNEGGVGGTYRFLKNIMGLWILQESKREWERAGISYSYPELVKKAEQASAFTSLIDPDDPLFLHPGDMPTRIRRYCQETGQIPPIEPGAVVRCILESLALKYRCVLEQTEQLTAQRFNGLYMVGGGIHNSLLCQWSANAIGKRVWAGPAEGSAIGNLCVQWLAQGEFSDIWEARRTISESFPAAIYEPQHIEEWDNVYGRFRRVTGLDK